MPTPSTRLPGAILLASVALVALACRGGPAATPASATPPPPMPMVTGIAGDPTPRPLPTPTPTPVPPPDAPERAMGEGASGWLWVQGPVKALGNLDEVAARFKLIVVDADPEQGFVTDAELATLKAGGRNKVLSVLPMCAVADSRAFVTKTDGRVLPLEKLPDAYIGPRAGRPGEHWYRPQQWYQPLVDYVAKRLIDRRVDGLFLSDIALLEHLPDAADGPCDQACRQGGLEVLALLRKAYPSAVIIAHNAPGDVLRLGSTASGRPVRELLDGVSVEDVAAPDADPGVGYQLRAWQTMGLMPAGRPFWVGTAEHVGGCGDPKAVGERANRARGLGFAPALLGPDGSTPACLWPL